MGKHQIIYTSCKRGISGVNDGMQIYSHDANFTKRDSDEVKGLFTYQPPALPVGTHMTDELAPSMPKNFLYRRLSDKSCAVALNTYLGRDYMGGPTSRFGNHLSHAIVCDEADFTLYPCELYGGSTLLSNAPDGVKASEPPAHLPTPTLAKGGMIHSESIGDFLATDNRMESYKKMLSAMLMYKSARKRVVICDTPENIIMWIATLHFALPLKIALNVNFSTYDHAPSLSASRICGVLPEGTKYNSNEHFTFDFIKEAMPDIEAESDFYDFFDMGMSLSYDSIKDFHEFVSTKLTYCDADEQYYQIYSLYCLLTDGAENMPLPTFKNAIQMSQDYAADKQQTELVDKLLENRGFVLDSTDEYPMEILSVLIKLIDGVSGKVQEDIRSLFAEKVISFFSEHSISESDFKRLYAEIESIGGIKGVLVPSELMKDINRSKLLSSMRHVSEQWKWDFIADKLCEYIATKNIPIDETYVGQPMNKLLGGIVALRVSSNANDGFTLAMRCLQRFSNNWKQFICMALGMENILQGTTGSQDITEKLRSYVVQFTAKNHAANKQGIYSFLLQQGQYEQIIGLYKEWIAVAGNIEMAKTLFSEQLGLQDSKYISAYSPMICDSYYDFVLKQRQANILNEEKALLDLVLKRNIAFTHIDRLVENVLVDVPIVATAEKHTEMLKGITVYYRNQGKTHYTGRLLILIAGMVLSRTIHGKAMDSVALDIKTSAGGKAIPLSSIQPKEMEKYLDWITPNLFRSCKTPNELFAIYGLFHHTTESTSRFFDICTKEALQTLKSQNSALGLYITLELLFDAGSDDDRIETGKTLMKQTKQTLESINGFVIKKFEGRNDCLTKWGEVYGIATKTISAPKKGGFFSWSKK